MDATSRPEGRMSVSMVAQWRTARNLFPIYTELVRKSGQCPPPFSSFGADDRPESLEAVRNWFDEVDASGSAAQFRENIEAIVGLNDTAWHTIALHFLAVRRGDAESRKKLDYILTRYFAISCPPSFRSKSVGCRQVAEVLEPLIGDCPDPTAVGPTPAHDLVHRLEACRSLAELVSISRDLDAWEESLGPHYLNALSLAQAAHVHYLIHLVAIETIQALLLSIFKQLKAARERGVEFLDCRAAGMGEKESIDGLFATWAHWSVPTDLEYRLDGLATALLGLEKALGGTPSVPDARIEAELSTLRALAERLGTQLTTVTQRLQRLESIVDLHGGWTPSAETAAAMNKFRVTPPPVMPQSPTITPIAVRPMPRTATDVQQTSAQPLPPGNGTTRS